MNYMKSNICFTGFLAVLFIFAEFAESVARQRMNPTYDINSLALSWEQYKLSNALRVVLQADLDQREVSIEFWIHAGTRNETQGKYGLAHFFEHATPYGLREDRESRSLLRSHMTKSNAQTRKDYTRYYIQVIPEGLELGLKYAADRLKADTSAITNKSIEKHREKVLAEIERNSRNPLWGAKATSAREAGTFGKAHPYGHSAYDTRLENNNFTAQDVKQWYDEYVFASNTILFVVGNFDLEAAKRFIERYFGQIHQKDERTSFNAVSAQHSFESITIETASEHHNVSLTWAIPEWDVTVDAVCRLLARILDKRLASDDAFPSSVIETESSYLLRMYELAGQFGVLANFSSLDDSTVIENGLQKNIDRIIRLGVSEEELAQARQREITVNPGNAQEIRLYRQQNRAAGRRALVYRKPRLLYDKAAETVGIDHRGYSECSKKMAR
ncbi:insulinase family protein [candidate division KSB1 bacterium]|nr:insulinase family protein [candidate division KSB1 bacterium]NIR73027.1 insulinase family protein [candidate division KSB1 bacterium]NIS23807.1 insulinase family protein [candidate division KSB1 bacterium]NIT70734.1 insulinase family protein [candidate division KSB1 bacterium]NIU24457.1 insulinase family protein [candidate division KSB1 bacterium]